MPAVALSVALTPLQNLHGYNQPWAGGAGKNKLPMTVDGIKAANINAPWVGNTYTLSGTTFTILTDNDNNVIGIKTVNGSSPQQIHLPFYLYAGNYIMSDDTAETWGDNDTYLSNGIGGPVIGRGNMQSPGQSFTLNETTYVDFVLRTTTNNLTFYPMIRLSTESDATFSPYTNICPISGRTGTTVSTRNEDNTETASATISFGTTVYGGQVDFKTGNVTVEWGYIASYNGETLPGAWISDRDDYAAGTTPTTGAEVCYALATPTTLTLTPDELTMLKGYNSVTGDGVITITAYTGSSYPVEITRKRKTKKKGGK